MSIPKKKLADVKRQVFAARVEALTKALEEGDTETLEQVPAGPTRREQRNMARLAARQMKNELKLETPKVEKREAWIAPARATREFTIETGGLVRTARRSHCKVVGGHGWTELDRGTTGIVVGVTDRKAAGITGVRYDVLMMDILVAGRGILAIPAASLRDATDEEEA
jgi:hypothetical protein